MRLDSPVAALTRPWTPADICKRSETVSSGLKRFKAAANGWVPRHVTFNQPEMTICLTNTPPSQATELTLTPRL